MKKLLFIIALITFSFSANAQTSKTLSTEVKDKSVVLSPAEAAKADAKQVQQLLGLTDSKTQDFIGLFQQKYETMAAKEFSKERRAELSRVIELKLRASLTDTQMQTLEANQDLYKKLIN
jgi:hypothetical protein